MSKPAAWWQRPFASAQRQARAGDRNTVPSPISYGPYQLLQRIGGGTTHDVYLARRTSDLAELILKTLPSSKTNELNRRRFERESLVMSQLVRSNYFAKFIDSGFAEDGSLFLAMEKVEGQTLWDVMKQSKPLADRCVLSILKQLAHGLVELHGLGYIHGDLAPKNAVLLGEKVKLIDLGLTRPVASMQDGTNDRELASGTPAFMSPEACSGEVNFHPTRDIYSFGCLAYFLLTAQPPLVGATTIEICWKQIHEQPIPLSQRNSSHMAAQLEDLIMGCLEKNPADRPQSLHGFTELAE